MKLSRRAQCIEPSMTMRITAKAKELRAAGRDILSFGAGEPDFDTPDLFKNAAIDALRRGETRYTDERGIRALREAIARKLERDNGLVYGADEVIVTLGAKHAVFEVFQALLDEGDEVIIPAPYWVSYPDIVRFNGGVPVMVRAGVDRGFKITPEDVRAAITRNTVALVLNSPCNPTGVVYTPDEIGALATVAVEAGLTIVSDEIYERLLYDGAVHASPAAHSEAVKAATVTVNGLSKSYSMTGWRLGYAAGPARLIDAMGRIQGHATSNAVSFAQYGALAALEAGYDFLAPHLAAFDERRKLLVGALNAIPGVRCPMPLGAFYAFPDVSAVLGRTSMDGRRLTSTIELAEHLLESVGVAVVPGEAFGGPGCFRLSYATATETVRRGAERIAAALGALR